MLQLPSAVSPHLIPQEPILDTGNSCWNFSLNFDNRQPIVGFTMDIKENLRQDWLSMGNKTIAIDKEFLSEGETGRVFHDFTHLKKDEQFNFLCNNSVVLADDQSRILFRDSKNYTLYYTLNKSANSDPLVSGFKKDYDFPAYVMRVPVTRNGDNFQYVNSSSTVAVNLSIDAQNNGMVLRTYIKPNTIGDLSTITGLCYEDVHNISSSNDNITSYDIVSLTTKPKTYEMNIDTFSNKALAGVYPFWNNNCVSNINNHYYGSTLNSSHSPNRGAIAIIPDVTNETSITSEEFFNTETETILNLPSEPEGRTSYSFSLYPLKDKEKNKLTIENSSYAQAYGHLFWKNRIFMNISNNYENMNFICDGTIQEPALITTVNKKDDEDRIIDSLYVYTFTIPYNSQIKVGMYLKIMNKSGYYDYLLIEDISYSSMSTGIMGVSVVLSSNEDIYTNDYYTNPDKKYEVYSPFLDTDEYYFEIRDKINPYLTVVDNKGYLLPKDNNKDEYLLLLNYPCIDFEIIPSNSFGKILYSKIIIKEGLTKDIIYEKEIFNQDHHTFRMEKSLLNLYKYEVEIIVKDNNGYLYNKTYNILTKYLFKLNTDTLFQGIRNLTKEGTENIKEISKINNSDKFNYYQDFEQKGVVILGSETKIGEES